MPLTAVHLLRHGEVHNPAGVLYGRLPGYRLSELGEQMARRVADTMLADGRDVVEVTASPLERAQQTAQPVAEAFGLAVGTDERLIEAENHFQGLTFGVGDGALHHPEHWWVLRNPLRPSWGEPYALIARRMMAALHRAREAAEGHEAVCVSHQLPIWTLRSAVEGRRFAHDPRKRQCSVASLTSFTFLGDQIVGVGYSEPARDLLPAKVGYGA